MNQQSVYRLPLFHCLLFCLTFLILGIGLGWQLHSNYLPASKTTSLNSPVVPIKSPTLSLTPIPTPTELPLKKGFTNITLYYDQIYYNPDNNNCQQVFPIKRQIKTSSQIIKDTLNLLFLGPTESEQILGFRSVFTTSTSKLIKKYSFLNNRLVLDLDGKVLKDLVVKGGSQKCVSAQFFSSIQKTLSQFPGITSFGLDNFTVNGSQDEFRQIIAL